ncbi:MAG: propionyl-CoA synthetase [Proteobacteria bacterium]|nr:propionyl-CoA synthetase [Pseudomonadota bacterium]
MSDYHSIFQHSIQSPQAFWQKAAEDIVWQKPFECVLDTTEAPFYRWFRGGMLNTCDNMVDRHVREGFGAQAAIIYDSPLTEVQKTISYQQLQNDVAILAGALKAQGVKKGDRVIIYMPMVPEAVYAMLACARIGAVHSVVFGGFSAKELASRIDNSGAAFIFSASCGLEPGRVINYKQLLDDAIDIATQPVNNCVILQRPQAPCTLIAERDIDWQEFIRNAQPAECEPVAATDPLYILYTSGTTGKPKGIVRDNGGHAVAMRWTMKNLYNVSPGEVYWAASDIGWVVGHSYIVYAPLLNRNTTILYEGKPVGTPDAGAFWRVISEHKVSAMFTAPTALRAIKKEDPHGELVKQYDISCLKNQFLAGERSDPDTIAWAQTHLKVPVIDHWWQTETAWAIATNPLGIEEFPIKPGSATLPAPGYHLQVLDSDGTPLPADTLGNLAVKLPLPPGTFPTIWGDQQRMYDNYLATYPGYYLTGDSGIIDSDGYVHVMSRIDDVINVAAHRLSTGQMEESLCRHPDVAEAAVFGIADDFKGELPLGLAILNNNCHRPHDEILRELIAGVRNDIGAVASFKLVAIVARLPKTRSGKILRATMRKIANQEEYAMPATIDDPEILPEIEQVLAELLKNR